MSNWPLREIPRNGVKYAMATNTQPSTSANAAGPNTEEKALGERSQSRLGQVSSMIQTRIAPAKGKWARSRRVICAGVRIGQPDITNQNPSTTKSTLNTEATIRLGRVRTSAEYAPSVAVAGYRRAFTALRPCQGMMSHVNTIRTRAWRDGEVVADGFPLADLDGWLEKKDTLVWADLCMADEEVLTQLAEELSLSTIAVEDAVMEGERVKLARHPGHLFITCYGTAIDLDQAKNHRSRLITSQLSVFVMPQGLVTVRKDDNFDIDLVLKRWDDDGALLSEGVFALLHGVLDVVVDSHFDAVQHLDDAIEDVEDMLFGSGSLQDRQEGIYRLRSEIVELRRVVLPMREVVLSINRRRGSRGIVGGSQEAAPSMSGNALDGWYDDLYDHSLRAAEWTESLRDMVGSLFETNLSLQDARLNSIMKKLAAWAAIIAVPTAVTGWFGQNVPYPGFGEPYGVWMSFAMVIVGSIALYLVFRKYDWI